MCWNSCRLQWTVVRARLLSHDGRTVVQETRLISKVRRTPHKTYYETVRSLARASTVQSRVAIVFEQYTL